jgi:hypothetical protein
MTCPPKKGPWDELEKDWENGGGGRGEKEGVQCGANHREAERGRSTFKPVSMNDVSRKVEGYGADLLLDEDEGLERCELNLRLVTP